MKKPSGRKVTLYLAMAVMVVSTLVFASLNPAETSPKCMPDYLKAHGSKECVEMANSSETSIEVINPDPR